MSELPPDESSIATAGADPGRRKAATDEARGANTNYEAPGERYPLSGGSRFRGGHDVDIYPFDTDEGPLVAEVKSRRSGAGFVTLRNGSASTTACFFAVTVRSPWCPCNRGSGRRCWQRCADDWPQSLAKSSTRSRHHHGAHGMTDINNCAEDLIADAGRQAGTKVRDIAVAWLARVEAGAA
jgi:hypothetical protein